jgi:uroporphyrinogen decarboxylase
MNDLFLRACRRQPVERPPVWMMRQAGRYLPQYREVRARADFLTMVHTPELAARVTLQPVDMLGVDAAIIFSDILVVLHGRVPLIGFAGAPWTLMSYMVEGSGTKTFSRAKRFLVEQPRSAHELLGRLAAAVGGFLEAQVAAGAQALQVFDSWAAALGPRDFREFALPYLAETVRAGRAAGVPVIAFAPGAGWALEEIATTTGADVIGVDWQTDAGDARRRLAPMPVALQGNLDPTWLYAPPAEIERRTHAMLEAFGGRGHIANLGHGILPDVPVEHAAAFVRAVQAWRPR